MDDHNGYWFKRRRYGWGWTPVAWQGWLTLVTFLILVTLSAALFVDDTPRHTITRDGMLFIVSVVILSLGLMAVTVSKGPAPHWRWGRTSSDNPEEDF